MYQDLIRNELNEAAETLANFLKDDANIHAIQRAAVLLADSFKAGGKVLSCGNGGSHCDAMHFAEELTGRYRENRPGYPAIAISDVSHLSCVSNDFGYEYVFSRYVESVGRAGDVLLGISTSGNSGNVIKAIEAARAQGMKVITLTGKDGGKMAGSADVEIRVPHFGYADRILLTKTDVAGESEKLRERLTRINSRAPIYTVTHGDIDLARLFNTNGFMLEENVTAKPRFHFMSDKQNDVTSIVVELDYPVDISEVSRVMENLLLSFADKLLRYKGMLWIDGEPNRLLFQGVQRLYSADWDRPWGDEAPHSVMVFIGIQLPEEEIRAAFAGLKK